MDRGIYRIIDANFNRAREGLRVMEEYCRFVLDSSVFSGRAKSIRHRLCEAIREFDAVDLVCSRDSVDDVGRGLQVGGQLRRRDLPDVFLAACKRGSEALRSLAEASQIVSASAAGVFDQLRFELYSLEKDVLVSVDVRARFDAVRLYVLVVAGGDSDEAKVLDMVEACCCGGADCVQLRAKGLEDSRLLSLSRRFVQQCRRHGVVSIINDRVDIAVLSGADGVHLGQGDIAAGEGRKLCSRPMIFGVSTHSESQLKAAIEAGADYVGLGPVFATKTKSRLDVAGCDYVRDGVKILAGTGVGHVAIGGIDSDNVEEVLAAGANAVAVCSAVCGSADPSRVCRQLKEKILPFVAK
jgi:thiamine-phosphate pyrophosphorylase